MGGSLAISTYLKYNCADRLGGIVSMYGINPLSMENMAETITQTEVRSKTPILLFNNKFLKDKSDIDYSANWISETY